MKKLLPLLVALALFIPTSAFAALNVPGGGTGSTTLTGILSGNGANPVKTVGIGSGLNYSGGVLSATNSGGTPGGASSTLQYNNNGVFGGLASLMTDGANLFLNAAQSIFRGLTVNTITATSTATSTITNFGGILAATGFPGVDLCTQANNAYAFATAKSVNIVAPPGQFPCATGINFGTNGKRGVLIGSASGGTEIDYTGTGAAVTVTPGIQGTGIDHSSGCGLRDITLVGNNYSTTSPQIGEFVGGTNGSDCSSDINVNIQHFGIGLQIGANAYHYSDTNSVIRDNGQNIHINAASNSGEDLTFTNVWLVDGANHDAIDCIFFDNSATESTTFIGGSMVDCQLHIEQANNVSIIGTDYENAGFSAWGAYTPIVIDNNIATNVNISGGVFFNDATSAGTSYPTFISNGGTLNLSSVIARQFGGQTVSKFVTLTGSGRVTWNGFNNVSNTAVTNVVGTIGVPVNGSTGSTTFDGVVNLPLLSDGCLTVTGGTVRSAGCTAGATFGTSSLSAVYPIVYTQTASLAQLSLAFGTTTSNTWAGVQTFTNSPVFSTLGAGTVNTTAAGTLYNTATSTITPGSGIAYTGTMGSEIGGVSGTLSVSGLTTSNFTSPNVSQFTNDAGYITSASAGAPFPFTPQTVNGYNTSATSTALKVTASGLGFDLSGTNWLSVDGQLLGYASSTNQDTVFGLGAGRVATTSATVAQDSIFGYQSMFLNTGGLNNSAFGYRTMFRDTTGSQNSAFGNSAALNLTSGNQNTAVGYQALINVGSGSNDTIIGANAGTGLTTGGQNTYIGEATASTTQTGSGNITIGYDISGPQAATNGSNMLDIGNLIYGTGMTSQASSSPAGNVGIGTSTPSSALTITTSGYSVGSSIPTNTWAMISAGRSGIVNSNNSFYFDIFSSPFTGAELSTFNYGSSSAFPMVFQANGGNVLIGTTGGGTPGSQLTLTGNMSVGYQTTAAPTNGAIIKGNVGIGTSTPLFNLHVFSTTDPATVAVEGVGTVGVNFTGLRANGTVNAKTAVNTNDNIFILGGEGYGTTAYSATDRATIFMRAAQTWTDSNQGTYMFFSTTPNNTTSTAERMRIDQTGNVGIGTTTPYAQLSIATQNGSTGSLSTLFAIASSTASATTTIFSVSNSGWIVTSGGLPVASSCGSTNNVSGNQTNGTVMFTGTLVTSCTITFPAPVPAGTTLQCTESDNSLAATADISATSTNSITFGLSTGLAAGAITWNCQASRNANN